MDRKNKNNPFRKEGGGRIEKSKKESEWGKVKFNPVAKTKTTATEQATPWSQFKNQIIENKMKDERESSSNQKNLNAKDLLKKREETDRINLIKSKRNEPTQWEDFSDETEAATKSKTLNGKSQQIHSYVKNLESVTKSNFDSRTLTFKQNNFLKNVITKNTTRTKGVSLKQAVNDMKLYGVKKKPFRK